ncbi:MAG: hypothetical protein BWX84_02242 [Verrucomicrobia bacterium ADurb.Bin118]|nr:MAG: hypothetical protein BWX84_02242 [Verrucomicrobia bacterium ADurb.Bin118]
MGIWHELAHLQPLRASLVASVASGPAQVPRL